MSAASLFRDGLGTSGAMQEIRDYLGDPGGATPPVDETIQTYVQTEYFTKKPPEGRARN